MQERTQVSLLIDEFFRSINLIVQKGHSAQHCLFAMQGKSKQAVDNSQAFETLLTDLSKAFDCLPDELLIAKCNAYGFSLKILKLINNYLYRRKKIIVF